MPLFSVIIPVFNRSDLVLRAIESVLVQTFTDYEIIVVDDGSTDGTPDLVMQRHPPPRVQVFRQANAGPGAARNLGIAQAAGEYIAFLDSDDLWFPWTLETFAQAIHEFESPTFVAGVGTRFHEEHELEFVRRTPLSCRRFEDYFASWREPIWIGMGSVAIHSEAVRRIGGLPNRWINSEDTDLWLRLGTSPGFAHILSPLVFAYRQTPNSAVQDFDRSIDGIRYLIEQERSGAYPGSHGRRRDRWGVLTAHLRSAAVGCLSRRRWADAWHIYFASARWNARLLRVRFLLAFPVLWVASLLRGRRGHL